MVEDRELIAARAGLSAEEQLRLEDLENQEWQESLEYVLRSAGRDRVAQLMEMLENYAYRMGVVIHDKVNTPYVNTISKEHEPPYPGNLSSRNASPISCAGIPSPSFSRPTRRPTALGGTSPPTPALLS